MDAVGLCRAADERFAVTGAGTPPWPDPHADRDVHEEEYSRCLDPAKYRILATRAEAWTRALDELGLAISETVAEPAATTIWKRKPDPAVASAVRLRPVRADALPLVFGFSAMDKIPGTLLTLGAGTPAVQLGTLPDCGCDACDDGSADLLDALDALVLAVVTGELVHIDAGQGREIIHTREGCYSSSDWPDAGPSEEEALAAARTDRSRHRVLRGPAWE